MIFIFNVDINKHLQIPHNKLHSKLYKQPQHIITIEDLLSEVIILNTYF